MRRVLGALLILSVVLICLGGTLLGWGLASAGLLVGVGAVLAAWWRGFLR